MFPVWVQSNDILSAGSRSNRHPSANFHNDAGCWGGGGSASAPRSGCPALDTVSGRPSPHSWVVGNWSRCSRSCDAGVRSRSVVCQRRVSAAEEKALDDSACPQPRPPVLEACHGPACPPEWAALDWSEVSRPSPPERHPTPCAEQGGGPGCPSWVPQRRLPTPAGPSGPPLTGPELAVPSSPPTGPTSSHFLFERAGVAH